MIARAVLILALSMAIAAPAFAAGSPSTSTPPSPRSTFDDGVKAVKRGDFDKAAGLFEKVVRRQPDNADAWNYLGFSHRNLGDYDDSLAAYQKALAIDPDHRGANEYLGELYLKMDQPDKAKERLSRLADICGVDCEEYDDLKMAIETFEAKKQGS